MGSVIIRNAKAVITCAGPAPRCGPNQAEVGAIADGSVVAIDGRIAFVGTTAECDEHYSASDGFDTIDAAGCTVLPGFVDPHTHVVFGGDRRDELRRRLAGATYAEIAASGGGILATVRATRAASEEDLVAATTSRLDHMLRCGTTT